MRKITVCPHCGGKYQYDPKNKAGLCDTYCGDYVEKRKWLEAEESEEEKRDLKKEFEYKILSCLITYRNLGAEKIEDIKKYLWQWIENNFTPK